MSAWDYINVNIPENIDQKMNFILKRFIVDFFCKGIEITQKNRSNMQLLLISIKNKNLYNELSEKIETSMKSTKNKSPTKIEPVVKKKPHVNSQVEYYCNETRDENRFVTAWFYINTNVKDQNENYKLKRLVVDIFCNSTNITDINRKNIENLVDKIK